MRLLHGKTRLMSTSGLKASKINQRAKIYHLQFFNFFNKMFYLYNFDILAVLIRLNEIITNNKENISLKNKNYNCSILPVSGTWSGCSYDWYMICIAQVIQRLHVKEEIPDLNPDPSNNFSLVFKLECCFVLSLAENAFPTDRP